MEEQRKIEIPEIVYQGDDKKLKERIFKFKAGSFRIAVFTVVGFIMGVFSHNYVRIAFFPMKLIMAIPYKASEAIYVSVIGTDAARLMVNFKERWAFMFTEFFPHSYIATFLAENVTTVLIGGAIYGSLAYFTGDSRVFTLRRFLKFAAVWCGVILTVIGLAYLVNVKAIWDNENLKGDPFFFIRNSAGSGRSISGAQIKEYFYNELEVIEIERDWDEELDLEITFNSVRNCGCRVNYEKQYLVTEQGKTYYISKEFAQIIREFEEKGDIDLESIGGESIEIIGESTSGEFESSESNPAESKLSESKLNESKLGEGTLGGSVL